MGGGGGGLRYSLCNGTSFIYFFLFYQYPESEFLSPEIHFSDSSTEPAGIDPTTTAMKVRCSTNPAIEELSGWAL